jgi:hypothetical protein
MCKIVTVTGCHEHPTKEGVYSPKRALTWLLHPPEQKSKLVWFSMCLNVIVLPQGTILGLGCPVVSPEVTPNTHYFIVLRHEQVVMNGKNFHHSSLRLMNQ